MATSSIEIGTLEDGVRTYAASGPPTSALTQIYVVYALADVVPRIPGELSVLLEWMQRGTTTRDRSALFDAFGALGVEPQLVAMAGGVLLSFRSLDACRTPVLEHSRELVYEPAFRDDERADVVRQLDEDDRASMDDPEAIAARARRRARWHGSTLASPVDGSSEDRAQLSASYLRELHASIFTRPSIIAVAGPQSHAWLEDINRQLCHNRPVRTHAYAPPARGDLDVSARDVIVDAPTMQHAVLARYAPGPPADDPEALAAAMLHHDALCDGMSAPLMAILRGEKSLSYSVFSNLVDRGNLWDQCYEIEPAPDRIDEALEAASTLWNDADALHDADFERARTALDMRSRLQSMDAKRRVETALRHEILWGRALDSHGALVDRVRGTSRSAARAAATTYGLSKPPICTVIVGPAKKMAPHFREQAMDLRALFGGRLE